jgi:hypothetical protein
MLESRGLRPAERWAPLAAASETVGGALMALGLFSPVGPIVSLAPMAMADGRQPVLGEVPSAAGGRASTGGVRTSPVSGGRPSPRL